MEMFSAVLEMMSCSKFHLPALVFSSWMERSSITGGEGPVRSKSQPGREEEPFERDLLTQHSKQR